jgi:NMD protein affecting ribosome stability and mRNA decay
MCRACGELLDTDDDGLCEECAKIKREEMSDLPVVEVQS